MVGEQPGWVIASIPQSDNIASAEEPIVGNQLPKPSTEHLSKLQLSLIIPAYKAHGFISSALQTVVSQVRPQDEIIVIDDGCPDGGYEDICMQFGPGIRLIRLARNRGVSAARNMGIAAAQGKHVVFLDADDQLGKGQFEAVRERFLEPDSPAVVVVPAAEIDQAGKPTGKIRRPNLWPDRLEGLLQGSSISTSQIAVSREALMDIGMFDPFIRYCEDWDLLLRLACRGWSFAELTEAAVHYRRHDAQASDDAVKIAHGWRQVLDHANAYLPEHGPYRRLARHARWNIRLFRARRGINRVSDVGGFGERWLQMLAGPRQRIRSFTSTVGRRCSKHQRRYRTSPSLILPGGAS